VRLDLTMDHLRSKDRLLGSLRMRMIMNFRKMIAQCHSRCRAWSKGSLNQIRNHHQSLLIVINESKRV